MKKVTRIHQLDGIIANQIAAGEVVERPASVVKELIENSLDAGATRVEIIIEKGGSRLILIRDNGSGIHPQDLTLSLSRHATSKIRTTEDLAAINSLGFRGEALASIASVSKLCLTSRWHQSDKAYQAIAEGSDMAVKVTPAALAKGTQIEVRDLFFNTPARRRFLRADKTEFHHIETMLYRMALSHPRVSFQLQHNGRNSKRFSLAHDRASEEKRLAQILGKEFLAHAVYFSLDFEGMTLSGWLGLPEYHRSQNDGQYFFVNGRSIRDRVINHAIREAYSQRLPQGRLSAYVIFLTLNPRDLDVNVHPTKHEVRFHQSRLVHDFLIRALQQVLSEGTTLIPKTTAQLSDSGQNTALAEQMTGVPHSVKQSYQTEAESTYSGQNSQSFASKNQAYSKVQNQKSQYASHSPSAYAQTVQVYGELLQACEANTEIERADINHTQENTINPDKPTTNFISLLKNTTQIDSEYLLTFSLNGLELVSLKQYFLTYLKSLWLNQLKTQTSEAYTFEVLPILFPLPITTGLEQINLIRQHENLFNSIGLKFFIENESSSQLNPAHSIKLLSCPKLLQGIDIFLLTKGIIEISTKLQEIPDNKNNIDILFEHQQIIISSILNTLTNKIALYPPFIQFFGLDQASSLNNWLAQQDTLNHDSQNWRKHINKKILDQIF